MGLNGDLFSGTDAYREYLSLRIKSHCQMFIAEVYTDKTAADVRLYSCWTIDSKSDLNPHEHVWDSLDRRLRRRPNPPANVNEFHQALIQEWNNVPQAKINTLVNSIRRRYAAVVSSVYGHTRVLAVLC